jgi:hypothetical protein
MPHRIRAPKVLAQAEREALRTELLERAHAWQPEAKQVPWPVITVSREYGALGAMVGKRVADRLGFKVWDRELLDAIARETGTTERRIEEIDERDQTPFDETLNDWLLGSRNTQGHYLVMLRSIVQGIARKGSAVIVGRGANFVLGEALLRVRVIAPFEVRVAGIAMRRQIPEKDARREVQRVEHERDAFVRRHFQQDVAHPRHYDLVVNTGRLSVELAGRIIADAYQMRFGDPTRPEQRPRATASY